MVNYIQYTVYIKKNNQPPKKQIWSSEHGLYQQAKVVMCDKMVFQSDYLATIIKNS